MLNYKNHLSVFWKTQKTLLLIFLTVLVVNIALQAFLVTVISGSVQKVNISVIMPTLVGVLIGMLIAVPVIQVTSVPFLLTLGSTRKDIIIASTINNIIYIVFISGIFAALLGIQASISKNFAAIYMGYFLTGWDSVAAVTVFNLFLLFMVVNAVFLIGLIFFRFQFMWGFGMLLLILSLPALLLKEFYYFFIWGGSYYAVCFGMFLIGILCLALSKLILSKSEVFNYRPKVSLKSFTFFILMFVVFSLSLFFGINRISSDEGIINENARFLQAENAFAENSFYSEGNENLHLSWRAYIDKGDLTLTIKSPSGETAFFAAGNTNQAATIPLTKGNWSYYISCNQAENGRYSLSAMIKE